MNLKVNLGKDKNDSDVVIYLVKENIHFVILAGESGSGKSIFHSILYRQLVKQNSAKELGFVIFDATRVDLTGWKSPYVEVDVPETEEALIKFEELSQKSSEKFTVVHIEEINMNEYSPRRFQKALSNYLKNNPNSLVVLSTSRIGPDTISENIRKLTDLLIVFIQTNIETTQFLLGDESFGNIPKVPGQRLLVFKDKRIFCKPFTDSEIKDLDKFFFSE